MTSSSRLAASAAVLTFVAAAHAQLKCERLPAEAGAPVSFSMDAHDVTAAEAIAAFRKQTGIDVVLNDDGPSDRGPPMVCDVKFDNLSRDTAVRELARLLSLGIIRNGSGPVMFSRNSWSDQPEVSDTPGVALTSVTRTQSFPPSPNQPDSLSLGLRVSPGRKPTTGSVSFDITPTVDDQGRTLTTSERGSNQHRGLQFGDNSYMELTVQLNLPLPRPKVLPLVKGSAIIGRPKTILRVSTDKLPDAAVDGEFDGGTISVGPPTKAGDGYELPITLTRGTMPADRWNDVQQQSNRMSTTMEITGDNGERLWYSARSRSYGQDTISLRGIVNRMGEYGSGRADARPVPRPLKLKWDTVVESQPEAVAFEFKDVQVP